MSNISPSLRASNYGTVLYIESIQYTPDGRSVITTRGERRFEVQNIRIHDGLHMANIEFITDEAMADGKSARHLNMMSLNIIQLNCVRKQKIKFTS